MGRPLCAAGLLLAFAACGGGGGGKTPNLSGPTRLTASPVEIPAAASSVDVLVELAQASSPPPTLLQVAVEVPSGLALATVDRLQAATQLATLDGDFVDDRFVVVCGDAQNAEGSPLPVGPLFRLRIAPASPRVPGTYTLQLKELLAASRDGQTPIAVETTPASVDVVVR
jgi:hypothetical protein